MRLFFVPCLIYLVVACATGAQAQTGQLQFCLAEAVDYSPVYATQVFPLGATKEVAAVIRLGRGESYPAMAATWIAADVADTPKNFVIRKIDMQMAGKDRAVVRVNMPTPEGMRAGKYRLEVTGGGKPWRSAEFSVAPLPQPVASRRISCRWLSGQSGVTPSSSSSLQMSDRISRPG
jgi:hypothetical protein